MKLFMRSILLALLVVFLWVSECVGEQGKEKKGWLGQFLDGLSLDLRTVENTDGGIAADFKWSLMDKSLYGGDIGDIDYLFSNAKINAQGMVGSKPADDDNTPREVGVDIDFDLKALYMEYGDFDYRAWLIFTAAGIEADQDFNNVNYIFKPFIQFDVPWTREVGKGLRVLLGQGEKEFLKPIILGFGYSLVSEIKGENGRSGEDRGEFFALYKIETYKNIFLTTKYRFFNEKERNYDLFEFTIGLSVLAEGSQAIVKYVSGELPLSLQESESLSIGWSITF